MATLVTGATGFIGSHIARKLVQRGEKVRILLRKTSNTINIDDIVAERVYGDVLDINSVKEAIHGCDTLYHTASIVSTKKSDYKKMEYVNIQGTINVFSTALENGVKKAVFTSTASAIGLDPEGGMANEETLFNLEHLGIKYINSKHYAEIEAMKFYEKGLPLVIVNPTGVIGAGDVNLSSTAFIIRYCKKKIPVYLESSVNLVDVEDVAEGHILASEEGKVGERYILGHKNLTVRELFSMLEKVTGIASPKIKITYSIALAAGFVAERILKKSSPNFIGMDVDSIKAGSQNWYFDSSKAVRELGFPQTPIEESLEKTIKWIKYHGYL